MSQIPPKNETTKPKSALDVAVNQLVRASVGGVPSTISDESLDKYVADLILKEAATKNKEYNKDGLRAYLPHTGTPPCTLPRTNKRFLFNVVKNVDGHNQALLRKIEEEAAARRRALNRSRRHDSDDERRRYSRRRHSDRYRRKDRKTSNTSDDYDRYYSDYDTYSDSERDERDRKSSHKERKYSSRNPKHDDVRSSSSRTKSSRRSVSPISSSSSSNYLDKTSTRLVSNELRKEQTNSSNNKSTSQLNIIKKGRGEVSNGSKMDKYFRKDYNPMFDIEPFIGENNWFNYNVFDQIITEKSQSLDDDDNKKKKKKHKEKSKHKKEKHKSSSNKSKKKRKRDSDSEISSDSEEDQKKHRKSDDIDLKPISIREWDKPKLISGTWDPDKTI
ncbi:hypothetical protein RhiirA5_348060 [Rhizophagus irregularis]|uniref:Uncharacterized protein n=1 Tax=Rhizophagus irregularis TaxID=588596 RepID=A0A2I1ES09_9GLOM|nr:hypothetical protein RhiirA5_348060 [Rhizophagus irregularis]PKC75958.1 hypothetical protein RhiirA1_406944 [Rhizophagus irregularis]PKY24894.1 hypothetical protein RhiirB3_413485 [Rhizophagus irregularis]CAB4493516.1 unnamed protein product [Rhizophagus irregularis]CAB5172718.1 unnamed protein product [Rhizophagus irregularis]